MRTFHKWGIVHGTDLLEDSIHKTSQGAIKLFLWDKADKTWEYWLARGYAVEYLIIHVHEAPSGQR